MASEEVVLAVRYARIVRVGSTNHPELIRVVALGVLHGDAVFQRLPRITSYDVVGAAVGIAEEIGQHFVARKFVGGRQYRVRFRLALDLLDFDQSFVAIARFCPRG